MQIDFDQAVAALEARIAEHDGHEAYEEYCAGLQDAIGILRNLAPRRPPAIAAVAAEATA